MTAQMRISISDLDTWQECQLRYHYSRLWKPVSDDRNMAIGAAVHRGIEVGILLGRERALEAAAAALGDTDSLDALNQVQTALNGVPQEYWGKRAPQAELKLEWRAAPDLELVGVPDLWYVDGDGIHVVEFKTTASDETSRLATYERWSPQVERYGVLIRHVVAGVSGLPIWGRFVVLSRRGKHAYGHEAALTAQRLEAAENEMLAIARQIINSPIELPTWSYACERCPYATVDEVMRSGGDYSAVLEEQFVFKGGRRATAS